MPQDGLTLSGRTVFAECMSVFDDLRAMEDELESLMHSMAELDHTSAEYSAVADRYQRVEHEFRTRDGYSIESDVGRVLMGLGFSKEDWPRMTDEFSGGWQMRLALAKLLLQKPNLLLLDEPTNHLDLEARNWLEEYLQDYPHAVVLISHDRYFLDVTVNKIAEIWNKRFWFYTGNYDKFLSQKTQRNEQLQAAYRTSATGSSSWKCSSTAFAIRRPRRSRCRAASKSWRRSSASRFRRKRRRFIFRFRSRSRAGGLWRSLRAWRRRYPKRTAARRKFFATSASPSSAESASRWSA